MLINYATPQTIDVAQDQLLLAGSKLSFTDIYNKEMDIPLVKKNLYRADDVDNVFILLNGVLNDVSENAFRVNKQLENIRLENTKLREQVQILEGQQDVSTEVDQLKSDMETLISTFKRKFEAQDVYVKALEAENAELAILIDQLVAKIETLS